MSATDLPTQLTIRIADENLPVLSAIANEARAMIANGNPTPAELEKLIRKDASLTSRILLLANSPIYGGRVEFSTISQAVVRMGTKALEKAILMAAAGDVFPKNDAFAIDLWEHSVAVAQTAHWLSERLGVEDADECFLAGIVHDVGKLLIYSQLPEEYKSLIDRSTKEKVPFHRYERRHIRLQTHEWVGGILGRKWGLTKPIVDVMRAHHRIEEADNAVKKTRNLVALVSLANMLTKELDYSPQTVLDCDVATSVPARILGVEPTLLEEAAEALPSLIDQQLESFR